MHLKCNLQALYFSAGWLTNAYLFIKIESNLWGAWFMNNIINNIVFTANTIQELGKINNNLKLQEIL